MRNRRQYLSLIGLALTGLLAGCAEDSDTGTGIDPTEDEEGGADEATEETDVTEEEGTEAEDGDTSDAEYVNQANEQVVLEYGETARVSTGLQATVHGVTLYDQMGDEQPEERDQFAVVQISTENTSDGQLDLPGAGGGGWEIFYGDQQHSQTFNYTALGAEDYEGLEGGTVQGGVTREGYILFEISEGYSETEIDTLWSDNFQFIEESGERIDVRWTNDP